jgi:hypothetical protein
MKYRCPTRFALLTLAAFAGSLAAQPASLLGTEEAPLPRYHVEIIVFAHSDGNPNEEWFEHTRNKARRDAQPAFARPTPRVVGADSNGIATESFDDRPTIVLDSLSLDELTWAPPTDEHVLLPGLGPDPALQPSQALDPAPQLPDEFSDQGAASATAQLQAEDDLDTEVRYRTADGTGLRSFRFRLLEPEELQLNDAYGTVSRLSAYEPLLHGGWVQEGLPEDQAHPFDLSYLGAYNPRGTVQLYLSRFLHVTLNLEFQPPGAASAGSFVASPFGLNEVVVQARYSLLDQRRLRSGELHYIDHPLFGVLVLVTPAPDAPQGEDSDAAGQTPAA